MRHAEKRAVALLRDHRKALDTSTYSNSKSSSSGNSNSGGTATALLRQGNRRPPRDTAATAPNAGAR